MRDTGAPRSNGDGSSGHPAEVTLREETCSSCSGAVVARALRLPCPGGGYVLHTRCSLDCVEWASVGNPLRCPVEACEYSRNIVLIDVARADPDVRG